jgi:hypothetical protein
VKVVITCDPQHGYWTMEYLRLGPNEWRCGDTIISDSEVLWRIFEAVTTEGYSWRLSDA